LDLVLEVISFGAAYHKAKAALDGSYSKVLEISFGSMELDHDTRGFVQSQMKPFASHVEQYEIADEDSRI
jgi:hypothetical protein